MIVHNFDPILIDLGIFQIRWYSMAYILGIVMGWMYANRIIKLTRENKYNFKQITTSQFDDLIIYLVIGIINLPSDVIKYYQYYMSVLNYQRAQNEIKILREELSKYEQHSLID